MSSLKLLRKAQVIEKTSLGATSIYDLSTAGRFPRPVKIGHTDRLAWIESEVDDWIQDQIKASREKVAA